MAKYNVTYYESFHSTIEVEADSPEQAEVEFWKAWETDSNFVDDVFSCREVTDSSIEC